MPIHPPCPCPIVPCQSRHFWPVFMSPLADPIFIWPLLMFFKKFFFFALRLPAGAFFWPKLLSWKNWINFFPIFILELLMFFKNSFFSPIVFIYISISSINELHDPPNPHKLRPTIYKNPIEINCWAEPTRIRWGQVRIYVNSLRMFYNPIGSKNEFSKNISNSHMKIVFDNHRADGCYLLIKYRSKL